MSQIRVARPTGDLAAASAFYGDVLGFAVLASFERWTGEPAPFAAMASSVRRR